VTPARREKSRKAHTPEETQDQTPAERRASMTWAKRLKRVFHIAIEICSECGGAVKVIAGIEYTANFFFFESCFLSCICSQCNAPQSHCTQPALSSIDGNTTKVLQLAEYSIGERCVFSVFCIIR